MEDATAVLAGTPGSVSGFVPFRNATGAEVTVHEAVVDEAESTRSLVVPVGDVVVGPGEQVRIGVELQLPSQTPPGTYRLGITIADAHVDATAHVSEARDLRLSPDVLVIENHPGLTARRTVVMANEGNVGAHVPGTMTLPLYREDMALTALRAATGARWPTERLDPAPDPVGSIDVTVDGGARVVAPGETEPLDLLVTVPDDLPRDARVLAALPISIRTLLLVFVPAGPAADQPT